MGKVRSKWNIFDLTLTKLGGGQGRKNFAGAEGVDEKLALFHLESEVYLVKIAFGARGVPYKMVLVGHLVPPKNCKMVEKGCYGLYVMLLSFLKIFKGHEVPYPTNFIGGTSPPKLQP